MFPSPLAFASQAGLGNPATVPVFTTCPHCSYLVEGTCVVCAEGDEHPSCEYCVGGKYYPPGEAWYRNHVFIAVATAIVVGVTSTLIISRVEAALKKRRARR